MRCLLAALLLISGCGGGVDGGPVVSTTPAPTPESAPLPPPQEDVVVPPAEAGKAAAEPIRFTLTSEAGAPLPETAYVWTTDEHSGWVFPPEGRSDRRGLVHAAWVPGLPGSGELVLAFTEDGEERTHEFGTVSVASARPPWGYMTIWLMGTGDATGYSMDLTPLTEPQRSYYAALNVQGAPNFYMGLQRGGISFDRQLQFSIWDSREGGDDARVIEPGEGAVCKSFDHEGSGWQCEFDYPWSVGETYRFETTWEDRLGGTAVTAHVTELGTGERRYLGTLGVSEPSGEARVAMFVEDFERTAPTCLDQPVRSAAYRRARVRSRTDGVWRLLHDARLILDPGDPRNPGTRHCANYVAREHPQGLELVIGGPHVRDPHLGPRVRIPE